MPSKHTPKTSGEDPNLRVTPETERIRRLVTTARQLDQMYSKEPETGKFYTLDVNEVYVMPVTKLAKLTGISCTMLYYFLNGRALLSDPMRRHVAPFIRMEHGTLRELGLAVRHERRRRFGLTDEPCRIPPPLFHYFKEISGIGASPKMEGKYKEMVESRKNKRRVMPRGNQWFLEKARELAESKGLAPDESGVYRKKQPASVVQTLAEVLGTAGLDEGGPGSV